MSFERTVRLYNHAARRIGASLGIPVQQITERQIVPVGGVTLNNISIDNSVVGVLNTGSIETVDAAVTTLNRSGETGIAQALTDLTQAVASNKEATNETKNEILEILSVVSSEATAPKGKRRSTAMKPMLREMATLLGGVASLSLLWDRFGPVLTAFFQ